jgi:hypothetical protein
VGTENFKAQFYYISENLKNDSQGSCWAFPGTTFTNWEEKKKSEKAQKKI